jgi:hypothetical protein
MSDAAEVRVTEFTLHVEPRPLVATVVRHADRSIGLRFGYAGERREDLTRANVAALRELLSRAGQAMLEAEWET